MANKKRKTTDVINALDVVHIVRTIPADNRQFLKTTTENIIKDCKRLMAEEMINYLINNNYVEFKEEETFSGTKLEFKIVALNKNKIKNEKN